MIHVLTKLIKHCCNTWCYMIFSVTSPPIEIYYIFREIDTQFDKIYKKGKHNLFVLDAALIYESGADTHMDYVIVVTSRMGLRTERVMQRGGLTREEFLQRVDLQWPDEDKIHLADFVIQNNSTEVLVKQEAKIIYDKLL